ncbi:hypothetical protein BX666DRAFT_1518602 [Dichotomocladium elegans]|nr:hypothetical protein BX666DRAFT_1518602 [Dichotomocladium elegans]
MTYFARATTTVSRDSITQQRHQAPRLTSVQPTECQASLITLCSAWKHVDPNNAIHPSSTAEPVTPAATTTTTAATAAGDTLLQTPLSPIQVTEDERMTTLRAELAMERRRRASLQKSYDAISQKMNHLHAVIKDKTTLIKRLENDKSNREQDMDLLLHKAKSVAQDARKWSFEANRYKQELEALRQQWKDEKKIYMTRLREKQSIIQGLSARLGHSTEEECDAPSLSSSNGSAYACDSNTTCSLCSASTCDCARLHPPTPVPSNNHLGREKQHGRRSHAILLQW